MLHLLISFKYNFLLVLTTILGCASFAQKQNVIEKIQFKSFTRGAHEQILITKDSVSVFKKTLSDQDESRVFRKLKTEEWDNLIRSISDVPLDEINTYRSPTRARTFDGAMHSSIILVVNDKVYEHSFDDENPHVKLHLLMHVIRDIASHALIDVK